MNTELTEYLLEKVADEPLAKRSHLYRLIVVSTDDSGLEAQCRKFADELDAFERRHDQLVLDFKRRSR